MLEYNPPVGELYCRKVLRVGEFPLASVNLEMYRAEESLSGSEEGAFRENGILIQSGGAIVDCTLRRYEGSSFASRLYGRASCEYMDTLMRVGEEPLVRATEEDWIGPSFRQGAGEGPTAGISEFIKLEEAKIRRTVTGLRMNAQEKDSRLRWEN